jgi:chromosome segregation ATPase
MTTNPPVTVTYTLEDLFTRFEQNINEKIDKQSTEVKEQFAEVKEQFDEVKEQFDEVNQKLVKLEVGQATLAGEIKAINERLSGDIKAQDERLSGEIKAVDERLSGDIKTLNATVAGIGKRIDNAEFFNRGVAIALVAAVFGGLVKWFGWIPTP